MLRLLAAVVVVVWAFRPAASAAQEKKAKPADTTAAVPNDTIRVITVTVKDTYEPSAVTVKKGMPVKMVFDYRQKSCAGTVVIDGYGIRQKLELGKTTTVTFTPTKEGTISFHCPMKMYTGTITVKK